QGARVLPGEQLGPLGLRVGLLVGSSRAAERRSVLGDLAGGDIDLLVGTHALIEESVQPAALGLVIHDEQQRFGAGQRLALEKAGFFPHVLSMSATPIPRTLQLTALGDLDISVINERPPGVPPVTTQVVLPDNRDEAYDLVRRQVAEGNQAFVICPLVEDSVALQVRSATTEHSRLQSEVFPELRVALLHGRMKPGDKDDVMQAFKGREYDILVSTAVVEVGVDVPRATVILVEGAERFGLAQLHQFRGRMYRGDQQSYCLLLSDAGSPEDNQRLQAMERFDNGFDLAEEDLRLRGPGDIFGQGMQHGAGDDLLVAGLRDVQLIAAAQADARRLLEEGIDHHPGLARRLRDSGATWAVS
ncbi:MAG: ATP-dependent helicase RecG, partial [Chloroflexota bacterium]|nr:ATP-dependent helicase RecG [Chloroflexota bacterium]